MTKILLENLQLPNGQVLDNRFFKSAMSETLADSQGAPSDELIALYDFWAKQGMGVLVTGNVMVDGRYLGEREMWSLIPTLIWLNFGNGQPLGKRTVCLSGSSSITLANRCIGQSIKLRLHPVPFRFLEAQLRPFVHREK